MFKYTLRFEVWFLYICRSRPTPLTYVSMTFSRSTGVDQRGMAAGAKPGAYKGWVSNSAIPESALEYKRKIILPFPLFPMFSVEDETFQWGGGRVG